MRWLSCEKVLTHLFELCSEVQKVFLHDFGFEKADYFVNVFWLSKWVYLADLFTHPKEPNGSLQELKIMLYGDHGKTKAMMMKLVYCKKKKKKRLEGKFPVPWTLQNFFILKEL